MKRRKFLIAGTTVGLSGCMKHADPIETLHPQMETTSTTYATIEASNLITGESLIGNVPWGHVLVRNPTEYTHGKLQLRIEFYDESQSLLQQRSHSIAIFPAGRIWETFYPFTTANREDVASIEAHIEQAKTGVNISSPDSIQIEEADMTVNSGNGVTISGVISTGSYNGAIQLIGLIYDSQSQFRGTVDTTSDELSRNEQWEFSASSSTIRTPIDRPQLESFDLRLDGTI